MDKAAICETLAALAIERYNLQLQLAAVKKDASEWAKKVNELTTANEVLDKEVTRLRADKPPE